MEIGIAVIFALVIVGVWFFESTKIGNKIADRLYNEFMKG